MLEVEDLHVSYGGVTALDGVKLSVPTHGITAVLGPNGAGKSTLLKSIARLIRPPEGRVTYNGRALIGIPPQETVQLRVSTLPQGGAAIRGLTVDEYLR